MLAKGEKVYAKPTAAPAIAGREGTVTQVHEAARVADVDFGDVHTMIAFEYLELEESADAKR